MDTRFLNRSTANQRSRRTHCDLFTERGWVYPIIVWALTLLIATFLPASIHAQATDHNSVLASGRIWIDPSITGHARRVLASVMRTLAPEDRENVVYVDLNNQVYANKPELLQTLYLASRVTDNSYMSPTGEVTASPQLTDRPSLSNTALSGNGAFSPFVVVPSPNSGGTGPFRRVYSKATTTTGYAWESASVSLKNSTNIYTDPTGTDTAYAYEGGWGATAGAVDAGFQYSSTYDNWSTVVQRESPTGPQKWAYSSRFTSNEEVNLKFYVPSDDNVAIAWTAVPYPTGTATQRTMVFAEPTVYGWKASGVGCILKRMTTIGQDAEDLSSGSYIKNIRWCNCLIGASSSSNHNWAATDVGGYQSYPDGSPKVSVMYVGPAEETDSIDLSL